ncbi:MAG: hypothetical protein L6W00_21340 [Lentisphaeria bacterium]|nr:MAG: hypothetical protein L6W00_21340 [Lentisphaeria bacterium]
MSDSRIWATQNSATGIAFACQALSTFYAAGQQRSHEGVGGAGAVEDRSEVGQVFRQFLFGERRHPPGGKDDFHIREAAVGELLRGDGAFAQVGELGEPGLAVRRVDIIHLFGMVAEKDGFVFHGCDPVPLVIHHYITQGVRIQYLLVFF